VAPQYLLIEPEEVDLNEDEELDGPDPDHFLDHDPHEVIGDLKREMESDVNPGLVRVRREQQEEPNDCPEFDTSFESTNTTPMTDRRRLTPDFVILHFIASNLQPDTPHFYRRAGLGITHECCPLIVECKRAPSRQLEGPDKMEALGVIMEQAQDDLAWQCAHAFKKYRFSISMMAIATAGDHWSYAHVPFHVVPSLDDEYDPHRMYHWNALLCWSSVVQIGSPESDQYLGKIRDFVVDKAKV
jgi:hypothetical protein